MCRPIVYLAGPISRETWEGAIGWREHARAYLNRYGIATLNPLRAKEFLQRAMGEGRTFSELEKSDYSEVSGPYSGLVSGHGILHRDRWDVLRSDLILANFEEAKQISIGTVMEVAWANAAGIYVLTAMAEKSVHDHKMFLEASSLVVPSCANALALIPDILGRETLL